MNTATRRIEINLIEGDRKTLENYSYACRRMANLALSKKFAFEKVQEFMSLTEDGKEIVKDFTKDALMNTSNMNFMYKETSVDFKEIPSCIRAGLTRLLGQTYQKKKSEIHKGLSSLPTYRNNTPIPFNINARAKSNFFTQDGKDFVFNPFGEKCGLTFKTYLGRDRSNNKAVIESIMKGRFKLCDSSIQLKDGKMFFLLTFQSPSKSYQADEDIVIGMNLGINCPAYVACNTGASRQIGNKESFLYQRLALQNSRKRLQMQVKFGKGGKGRTKKMQALERYKEKERNFVKTYNHKLSYDIVQFAIENNASKILVEDLKDIARPKRLKKGETNQSKIDKYNKSMEEYKKTQEHIDKFVLRNWSYFELQSMIKYKAAKWGIEVEVINPAYITQTCFNCGHVDENNVDGETVKCVSCGEVWNKDKNAAFNVLKNYTKELLEAA